VNRAYLSVSSFSRSLASIASTKSARVFVPILLALSCACTYMKMNPPPDADKVFLAGNNSCYLATAANMLAGAGYGNGATVQARANDIYGQLIANFGTANGGWADTAVTWWLSSTNNVWPTNPYTVVTVYGNKSPKNPWANSNGARDIGNELRACHFVGLSISWPVAGPTIGSGGHAITGWGDRSGNSSSISANPSVVRLTDSDNDGGGDVQQYTYDAYTNPNPGGANEGNGWYINYDPNHPYIKHIVTLAPVQNASGTGEAIQRVTGSYKIHQTSATSATDLHYKVGTDVDILSYNTRVDWVEGTPKIAEESPRRKLSADWDFSGKPVPQCTWVTITTELVLRNWNAVKYEDVHFTYPSPPPDAALFPWLNWEMKTPIVPDAAKIRDVTGGYVVAAFDVVNPSGPPDRQRVGEYRLVHQYSFTQSPEHHVLRLSGREGFQVQNIRVGHSYGMLETDALWKFSDWMTTLGETFDLSATPKEAPIDWTGRLPYPPGEDITGRVPRPEPEPEPKR
jgi:hypothetical protein